MKQEPVPLGSIKSFEGAGIYVIYYTGNYEPYSKLGELNRGGDGPTVPIYIGKAIPSGGRKGLADPEISAKGRKLFERLEMHRKSIEAVGNLELEDFVCRYLVVDDVWIPLGESLLIQRHRPIWNSLLEGFGNNTPGKGRFQGARPTWDTLHPGRSWAKKCAPSKISEEQILHRIEQYWEAYEHIPHE